MSLVVREDIGTTPRRRLMPHRRLQVWERSGGVYMLCQRRIDDVRERWIVGLLLAHELGGADDIANMGPAHAACALIKPGGSPAGRPC